MEQTPTNQTPRLFIGIVIFSIFIILILVLNYFNILNLSTLSPNLGFLPHRPYEQFQDIKPTPIRQVRQGFPTPNPNYSSSMFRYDTEKAKKEFTDYIKSAIKPDIVPSKIDTIQRGTTEEFDFDFKIKDTDASSLFHYNKDSNIVSDISIFLHPQVITGGKLTPLLANSLLSSYFNNPYTISSCEEKDGKSYCEQFKKEEAGKKGYAVVYINSKPKTIYIVATCFIPKESKLYENQNTCIRI